MYQVDWQEYQNIQEYNSEQYKDLEEALKVYKDKAEMYYWAKLSHELLEGQVAYTFSGHIARKALGGEK